jgi:hypothetical protein
MAYFIIVSVYGEYPCTHPLVPLSISAAKRNLMNSSYTLIFFLHPNNVLCWLGCPEQRFCFILARLKAEKNYINKIGIGFLLLPTSLCRQVFFVRQIPIHICSSAHLYLSSSLTITEGLCFGHFESLLRSTLTFTRRLKMNIRPP